MTTGPTKTPGQVYEGIAFTFCKCATVALVCGRFALPVAAFAATVFYVLATIKGERGTRCVLGPPLVVAAFWAVVGTLSLWLVLDPGLPARLLSRFGPAGR
ncbi:MAG: hypothetical protein JST30_10810 [Armatimonadetes bacterium]|nr:hypothetical protein [Armatimonadota bacterium]